MKMDSFLFQTLQWDDIPEEEHTGESGKAFWKVKQMNNIRIRKVRYTPGYKADHWCSKGHVLHCVDGEMDTELEDGRVFKLTAGMTYLVGDNNESHRSFTASGCQLFIVD
jgi:hypothetical protein